MFVPVIVPGIPVVVVVPSPVAVDPTPLVISPTGTKDALAWQNDMYLEAKNASAIPMQVSLMYVGTNEKGEGVWLPGAKEKPLTFTLKAGETVVLTGPDGGAIRSSRIRVWAETEAQQWFEFQAKDLVLVEKPYQAVQPTTFPLVFAAK